MRCEAGIQSLQLPGDPLSENGPGAAAPTLGVLISLHPYLLVVRAWSSLADLFREVALPKRGAS